MGGSNEIGEIVKIKCHGEKLIRTNEWSIA